MDEPIRQTFALESTGVTTDGLSMVRAHSIGQAAMRHMLREVETLSIES